MLKKWALSKLEMTKDKPSVLVRDPLHLLPETDSAINKFAKENGYVAIVATTNLVFRELYEHAVADSETKKILVIDRTPQRRRKSPSPNKAPPLFYPDFLAKSAEESRIYLDLQQFLREKTGDPDWPQETNDPRYAKLIVGNLEGILQAHKNLRTADERRFTDHDFKTIVAFASLGVAGKAFKNLDYMDYWTIGLLKHKEFNELVSLAPEVTRPIKDQLSKAEAPFCWFDSHNPEMVVRAFYLSTILSQHFEKWQLLLANIDPMLKPLSDIKTEVLRDAAPRLVELDPDQAEFDLIATEDTLTPESLKFLLLDQMKITEARGFASVIETERYSALISSLALLLALDDLLSDKPALDEHNRIHEALFAGGQSTISFVDNRESPAWSYLKEAYRLAFEIRELRDALSKDLNNMRFKSSQDISFENFFDLWNNRRINRLEYYLSSLVRVVDSYDLLPRPKERLPKDFLDALGRIRQRVRETVKDSDQQLDDLNRLFQAMVEKQYPTWIDKEGDVLLTSQFLRRGLKPNWDPETEKAVVFIFDGMRYDIWDEFLRPMLSDRMELIREYQASALLPSETHISRKAISAGTYPDQFDTRSGEDRLLKEALAREFRYDGEVKVLNPEGSGTGETVRYSAGNLDVYIFDLCDTELHRIRTKTLPDGRKVPAKPIALIYQQLLKDIFEHEVMAIVRDLKPGTKVFVTADHGFVRVGHQPIWFEDEDLNETNDCSYLNCRLKVPLAFARIPDRIRENIISFRPEQLRIPAEETVTRRKMRDKMNKKYGAIVFPRTGYSFSRRGSHYDPYAFTHGGISIQELMIPMVALRVRSPYKDTLTIDTIKGPHEAVEGEELEFHILLRRHDKRITGPQDLRVDMEASYSYDDQRVQLPQRIAYLSPSNEEEVSYRFRPNLAALPPEERSKEAVELTLAISVSYHEGRRTVRKSKAHSVTVRLNSERIIRRVGNLGNILGLTPKSLKMG